MPDPHTIGSFPEPAEVSYKKWKKWKKMGKNEE